MEKENSEFKPVKLRLKIDLVSYPARAEELVNRLTIRLFSVISRILVVVVGVLPLSRGAVGVFYSPSRRGENPAGQFKLVCMISSQCPKTVGVDYSRIEYMRNIL